MIQRESRLSLQFLALAAALPFCGLSGIHADERTDGVVRFRQQVQLTKQAFRDVVASPRAGTVQFLAEGNPVSLGMIVSAEGFLITKASQAGQADKVKLTNGKEFSAQLIGTHQARDLALFKIDAVNLSVPDLQEEELSVGAWTAAVGFEHDPVSIGVMSVSRRAIPPNGEHGVLGIELERDEVPRIRRVYPNSGAEIAGLTSGDVVLQVDQKEISTGDHLVKTIRRYRPGDTVQLKIRRNESNVDCSVTLTHPFGGFLSRLAFQNQMGGALSFRRDDFEAVYQSDMVIAPEECGGPVVGLDGKVIGINIARAGRTETYILPIDLVLATIQELQPETSPQQTVVTRKPGQKTETKQND